VTVGEVGGVIPGEVARRIALVVFDVDGVLTDAGVYLGRLRAAGHPDDGSAIEFKRFDIQDGLGLKMLQWAGLEVIIVSGRISEATRIRAEELGVELFQDDLALKIPAIQSVMNRMDIGWEQVAMLADDLPDVAVLRRVGLKAAVANAAPIVADMADWRSTRRGGYGAAREFCDALLTARGQYQDVVEHYVRERS
jgi:3-deoxy-D-manno-octulosonate 8-phosphate phosphatase (KDO 8-P phosphatase)